MTTPSLPSSNEIHLWVLEHNDEFKNHLSKQEQARAKTYRFKKDQQRYLFTQSAKREILGRYLKQAPQEVSFHENEHGKPFVEGLEFSISHTRGNSLLAVSSQGSLGVDIEQIEPQPDLTELARRICSDTEIEAFKSAEENQQLLNFYKLWTAKEAYLKNLGIGFELEPETVESDFPKLTHIQALEQPKIRIIEVSLDSHHVAFLATNQASVNLTQHKFYTNSPN